MQRVTLCGVFIARKVLCGAEGSEIAGGFYGVVEGESL